MISFHEVTAKYPGASRNAVDSVSFEANSGEITAVAGPNGSGKSTLVRALLRRIELLHGTIKLSGTDISELDGDKIASALAVLPQREDPVFPLTVQRYVGLGRYPHLGLWKRETPQDLLAVESAMHRAQVTAFAARGIDQLSGGEWQRVRIARALAQGSSAIVLDEPTTFLDISHEMALFELLNDLAREGLAVLVVSHELNLVARFASRIILVREGKVVAAGSPFEVMLPDILERVFDWPLYVAHDPSLRAPALFPLRRPDITHSPEKT